MPEASDMPGGVLPAAARLISMKEQLDAHIHSEASRRPEITAKHRRGLPGSRARAS